MRTVRPAEMEPRDWDQEGNANTLCRCLARAQWLLGVAVCIIVGGLLHVSVAHGMCCVCEGVTTPALNTCLHLVGDDCATCQLLCTEAGGTVRACCADLANCHSGRADSCFDPREPENVCLQTAIGSGFCDGTCTASTPTATATATGTATATSTATPTATLVPEGGACMETAQCEPPLSCIDEVCTGNPAPAPTLTPVLLFVVVMLLAAIAAVGVWRRR